MKIPKNGFWHPNIQKGWKNSSPGVGYSNNQITDEQYYATVAIHDPLWRYVISHYDAEIYDHLNTAPVAVLGYRSLPVAIELTQWGYDVTILTRTLGEFRKAQKDCVIQAGSPKEILYFDYTKNIPRVCVVCFIDVISDFEDESRIFTFLDLCLRRSREVVCAVRDDRDWKELLSRKYVCTIKPYPVGKYLFMSLTELRS